MKYFLDTEFLEGNQKKLFGKTKPTIDLISIGIVCEDGRTYYAISKDFNLKEAWNRYDLKDVVSNHPKGSRKEKVYWIRDNVLKHIFDELLEKETNLIIKAIDLGIYYETTYKPEFCYNTMKFLINKYGNSNKQISDNIKAFCSNSPEFYGYYSDYDWVVFCWLFGRMIDLPKGFPMYCIDLKQMYDETAEMLNVASREHNPNLFIKLIEGSTLSLEYCFQQNWNKELREWHNYPKQINEHNALGDAQWNFELYKFLQQI